MKNPATTRYRVTYEIEARSVETSTAFPRTRIITDNTGVTYRIPADAELEVIRPAFVGGYYRHRYSGEVRDWRQRENFPDSVGAHAWIRVNVTEAE